MVVYKCSTCRTFSSAAVLTWSSLKFICAGQVPAHRPRCSPTFFRNGKTLRFSCPLLHLQSPSVCLSDALLSSSLHLGLSTASLQARKLRAVIGLTSPLQIQVPESPSPVSIAVLHVRPLQPSLSRRPSIVTTLPSRGSGRETARAPTAALTWRFSTLRAHATNARL